VADKGTVDSSSAIADLTVRYQRNWKAAHIELQRPYCELNQFFENRICLTISETAFALGLSPKSVERLVKRGELRSKRAGRRILISRSDIEAWLNQ